MKYEASQVDETTWMVKRTDENGQVTESLLRDMPTIESMAEEFVIRFALRRNSWA